MGLYIKGMEMPKGCESCPFWNEECFGAYKCEAVQSWGSDTERASGCPLIPVPEPHGDLIDASEKIRVQMYDDEHEDFHTVEMTIDDLLSQSWVQAYAFPIIPASEEG